MENLTLTPLNESDLDEIANAFKLIGWHKPKSIYVKYLQEQSDQVRSVVVAKMNNQFCGYVTLKWHSTYSNFIEKHIPEIVDLNVLPNYRNQGVGTQLIKKCEGLVKEKGVNTIGIGVGLIADYGNAQRLYFQLGYKPDGKGLHYQNRSIQYGENVIADDDLVIYFTKKL